jgi:hypothetical protein
MPKMLSGAIACEISDIQEERNRATVSICQRQVGRHRFNRNSLCPFKLENGRFSSHVQIEMKILEHVSFGLSGANQPNANIVKFSRKRYLSGPFIFVVDRT